MEWDGIGMVIIGHRSSKSTFGAIKVVMEMYKECLTPLPHDLLQVFQEPQLAQEASLRAENFYNWMYTK